MSKPAALRSPITTGRKLNRLVGEILTPKPLKKVGTELANVRCKQRKDFFALFYREVLMSSLFTVALCLITLFTLASCASSTRTVAAESEVKRSPEGDFRSSNFNKELNRQYVREKY